MAVIIVHVCARMRTELMSCTCQCEFESEGQPAVVWLARSDESGINGTGLEPASSSARVPA